MLRQTERGLGFNFSGFQAHRNHHTNGAFHSWQRLVPVHLKLSLWSSRVRTVSCSVSFFSNQSKVLPSGPSSIEDRVYQSRTRDTSKNDQIDVKFECWGVTRIFPNPPALWDTSRSASPSSFVVYLRRESPHRIFPPQSILSTVISIYSIAIVCTLLL